jgi:hypothetical protein
MADFFAPCVSQEDPAWELLREQEQVQATLPPAMPAINDSSTTVGVPSCPSALPRQSASPQRPVSLAKQETVVAPENVYRRLRSKQPCLARTSSQEAQVPTHPIAGQAIAAEAWHELVALDPDARRQHIHWTHVRTKNPGDRQPESFTRAGFFEHLTLVYRETYPEAANRHGSIVLFGAVAKEHHAALNTEGMQFEHHHAPLYCSKRHAWKAVADVSYTKYKVNLNAACHSGYSTMYNYIKCASPKKPISELDAEVYLSVDHPRGESLKRLLEAGVAHMKYSKGVANRRKRLSTEDGKADGEAPTALKRFRGGDVFGLVAGPDVQALAANHFASGDARLAEFCTSCGEDKLGELVRSAVAVLEAPKALALKTSSRMDLLRRAASEMSCTCQGVWMPGARQVLEHQGEDVGQFCRDVCRAFELGARRGVNMAVIGEPGCGKSMLFEPFDSIFSVMGKPEGTSTFALANVVDAHVLLWQEYKHKDSTVMFEDILAICAGERMEIREPHKKNRSHRNTAPLFYTCNVELQVVRADPVEMNRLNGAMQERFCTQRWLNPIPMESRRADFPRCGCCCAKFFLLNR